jgi:hypothetical protein
MQFVVFARTDMTKLIVAFRNFANPPKTLIIFTFQLFSVIQLFRNLRWWDWCCAHLTYLQGSCGDIVETKVIKMTVGMTLMRNTMTSTCKPVIWGALCRDSCIRSASSETFSSSLGLYVDLWPILHQENWKQDNYFLQALPSSATVINMIYYTLFCSRLLVYIEYKSIRSVMFNNWGFSVFFLMFAIPKCLTHI